MGLFDSLSFLCKVSFGRCFWFPMTGVVNLLFHDSWSLRSFQLLIEENLFDETSIDKIMELRRVCGDVLPAGVEPSVHRSSK